MSRSKGFVVLIAVLVGLASCVVFGGIIIVVSILGFPPDFSLVAEMQSEGLKRHRAIKRQTVEILATNMARHLCANPAAASDLDSIEGFLTIALRDTRVELRSGGTYSLVRSKYGGARGAFVKIRVYHVESGGRFIAFWPHSESDGGRRIDLTAIEKAADGDCIGGSVSGMGRNEWQGIEGHYIDQTYDVFLGTRPKTENRSKQVGRTRNPNKFNQERE